MVPSSSTDSGMMLLRTPPSTRPMVTMEGVRWHLVAVRRWFEVQDDLAGRHNGVTPAQGTAP